MSISKEDKFVLDELSKDQLPQAVIEPLRKKFDQPFLSIYWEIKTLFAVGVGFLTVGIGEIIYEELDSHQLKIAILTALIIAVITSTWYCFNKSNTFTRKKVEQGLFFNATLLLCTSLFLTLEGYLQFEYSFFGERYAEMAIIPTLFFFFCAFYFDNKIVLTKGIIAFTAWFAIKLNVIKWQKEPFILPDNLPGNIPLEKTILIGFSLLAMGYVIDRLDLKKHFKMVYVVFAVQVIMLALTVKWLNHIEGAPPIYLLLIIVFSLAFYWLSVKEKSLPILFTLIVYLFISFTTYLHEFISDKILISLYYIFSGLIIIRFLISRRKVYAKD